MEKVLILGGGGFIGSNLAMYFKKRKYYVTCVDLHPHFYPESMGDLISDKMIIGDLRDAEFVDSVIDSSYSYIFQLAADMGGAGYIFTQEHDSDIMHNSAMINLNVLHSCAKHNVTCPIFYASSACVYPEHNQLDPDNPLCEESSAYPANPDSEYGWEKLFSERLYFTYKKNKNLNVKVGRFHNIYGELSTYDDGREKAPAAMCRKVKMANDHIEVWGDGKQTRSFLYIQDAIDAMITFVNSTFDGPVNIGSEEMVSINKLAELVIDISGKNVNIKNVHSSALGVRGRNSDNKLIGQKLGWSPNHTLKQGMEKTYKWISEQIDNKK